MTGTITNVESKNEKFLCEMTWDDGYVGSFLFIWLRDHCLCESCLHPVTHQRLINTLDFPIEIKPSEIKIDTQNREVVFLWDQNTKTEHTSKFPFDWLKIKGDTFPKLDKPIEWDNSFLNEFSKVTIDYEKVLKDKSEFLRWLQVVNLYGFALVKGVPTTPEATQALCEMIGPLKHTIYGPFWDIVFEIKKKDLVDTAYETIELGQHTDGTYFCEPPGIQFFHITEVAEIGGESILSDTFAIASYMKKNHPKEFEYLSTRDLPFHHKNENEFFLQKRKVFVLDDEGNMVRFNYNNDDRTCFSFKPDEELIMYKSIHTLLRVLKDPKFQVKFQLEPGTLMMTNNWRVTHGRTSFIGRRRLMGAYINNEDYQSKLLQLQQQVKKN